MFDDEEVEYTDFEVDEVLKVGPNGLLCSIDGEEVWIPKQYLEDTDLEAVGDKGSISIPTWLAEDRDLV